MEEHLKEQPVEPKTSPDNDSEVDIEKQEQVKIHPAVKIFLRVAGLNSGKFSGHHGIGENMAINDLLYNSGLNEEEIKELRKEIDLARGELEK